ncbi:hypothetical protein RDABS01_014258 [Bienertia sinuspersici]
MGRDRSRSRSYSPRRRSRTPPRRKRYNDHRGLERHHRRHRSPAPCGLLVRNVALSTRSHTPRTERSPSPRDHSSDERERTTGRFRSPKESSPYNEKRCKSTRYHNVTLHENYKSPSSPTLRENSLHNRKNTRSSGRSISSRKESLLTKDCKAKQKEISSPGDNYRSNKSSLSPQESPAQDDRICMSNEKILSPRDISSEYEKVCRLEQRSISPRGDGGSPLRG